MAIQITWLIESMLTAPVVDSHTDVVVTANWRCNGTDGVYSASNYGSVSFETPGVPFTPYDQLTEEQVLEWVWETVNQVQTEESVTAQVGLLANPPVVTLPNPW